MAPEQRGEFLGGQWPTEIVALPLRAALVLEECALLSSFDPFRHHTHTQTGPHADHGADEADIVRNSAHEGVIDLQPAERKALQPVPKSSSASRTPMRLRACSCAAVDLESCIRTDSVSSSSR